MELQRIQNQIQMYSPINQNNQSPFTCIRTSNAPTPANTHTRTTSVNKSVVSHHNTNQITRVPSNKKLSLTYQAAQFRPQKGINEADQEMKRRAVGFTGINGRFVSLQSSIINEKNMEEKAMMNQSVMRYFHQQLQTLKNQYFGSLRTYEQRIDQLQKQLNKNSMELQDKNNQIRHLEQIVKQQQVQANKAQPYLQRKLQDVQAKISILTQYAQQSLQDTQQNIDNLTKKVINCFGNRLSALRKQQAEFINLSLTKISNISQKIQAKEKQESVGTRQSIQSVQQTGEKIEGISFWDDCFFYPTSQKSENCCLIAQMASKRSEPFKCWVDNEGYLRYCDSGSFFFNRKGEKIGLEYTELVWLQQHKMIKI